MELELQRVFMNVFNNAYNTYNNETRAFRIAWGVIKKLAVKNKKGIWIRKKKREEGKLKSVILTKAMIEEVIEKEEKENIKEVMEAKDLELKDKQSQLLDKLLKNKE
jgi:hypothetical protein